MRSLTIQPRISPAEFHLLADLVQVDIPPEFMLFMQCYAGGSVEENKFVASDGAVWEIAHFINFSLMYDLTEESIAEGYSAKIPFAVDSGGWPYRVELRPNKETLVFIDRRTDGFMPRYVKLADSFAEFVDGLNP